MAGNVTLTDLDGINVLDKRKDHGKYVVRIATYQTNTGSWIATAGWDSTVFLYFIAESEEPKLNEPIGKIRLFTNPEAILLVESADGSNPLLVVSRRDSTFLYYYEVPDPPSGQQQAQVELKALGKQNLAPHALSWVSFTPSDIALCPTDPSLLAVATSSMPHMKVLVVRMLKPVNTSTVNGEIPDMATPNQGLARSILDQDQSFETQQPTAASVVRADIVRQDREETAILISCNTMAPQTQYSTPVVIWRPNGSGIWTNGDDGVIRGVETSTGKVVARLECHESGSKIRCLWAGEVRTDGGEQGTKTEELLVSGGFDQRLVVWRTT